MIVVRKDDDGQWKFLLLRAYGYWDFPKGIVEPGEDPVEAAKRETREETTITDLDFKWGYDFRETGPYNRGRKIARYYLAETKTKDISLP
ncbi:MAG: NUDIX domain-containing protein, partial [Thermodesulfobacteria bacterium]|nr:NUDIX domain-containing protein [Thermodesulfobacteriota bacterium]